MITFSGFLREGFEEKTAEHWKNLGKSDEHISVLMSTFSDADLHIFCYEVGDFCFMKDKSHITFPLSVIMLYKIIKAETVAPVPIKVTYGADGAVKVSPDIISVAEDITGITAFKAKLSETDLCEGCTKSPMECPGALNCEIANKTKRIVPHD